MRLSAATSRARPVTVGFEGGDLNATYRPTSYTPNQLAAMQAKAKASKDQDEALASMVKAVLDLLVSWDLEDDDGNAIPLTPDALMDVPLNVHTEVIKEIGKDQQAGDTPAP